MATDFLFLFATDFLFLFATDFYGHYFKKGPLKSV